ncbi:hypothetical protein QAO67_10390 [Proteus mirabilis]|uniref:hypothetical protein n=1 Tax=Proteus mirabilis TaxID=584 RepID=UPI002479D425|nr:hypothetical protein [Proteus mirabilis]MDH7534653.1 hypothetical protein [Proteus mirabilis]
MRRVRNHHHVSLRYFGHLRLTRQQEGSPPITLSGLFFVADSFMLFTLSTIFTAFSEPAFNIFVPIMFTRVIDAVLICCETRVLIFLHHDISPLKSPAIARLVVVQFPVLLSCLNYIAQ